MARKAVTALTPVDRSVRAQLTTLLLLGVGGLGVSVAGFVIGSSPIGFGGVVLSVAVTALAFHLRRAALATSFVNRAFDTIARGRLAEAEALLDEVEARPRPGHVRRSIDVVRATIAFRRGDVGAAIARADTAVERPLGILGRSFARLQRVRARALRALLLATQGDEPAARADVAEVRRSADADADALARVELAEAIVLERSGDRQALGRHLAGARGLLLEYGTPRERAVVRAYQRMLEAKRASIYRESPPRSSGGAKGDEPTLADWIEAVVPGAAPYARPRAAVATAPVSSRPTESIDPAARRAAEARLAPVGPARKLGRALLSWALVTAALFAAWEYVIPELRALPALGSAGELGDVETSLVLGAIVAFTFARVAVGQVRGDREAHRLFAAVVQMARGDEERGEAELRALTKSRYPLVAARSWLELAGRADRRAAFSEALDACERGLKALSSDSTSRAVASGTLLPELLALHALALVALDREVEARAEMSLLDTYPAYAYRARAELRFALRGLVRREDLRAAAALVAEGTEDIPLSLREEFLADVVRAAVHPESVGAGEIERLERELITDPRLAAWMNAVAPAALEALTKAGRASPGEGEHRDGEAEREAEAELEALHDADTAAVPRRALPAD